MRGLWEDDGLAIPVDFYWCVLVVGEGSEGSVGLCLTGSVISRE